MYLDKYLKYLDKYYSPDCITLKITFISQVYSKDLELHVSRASDVLVLNSLMENPDGNNYQKTTIMNLTSGTSLRDRHSRDFED